jgi:hypothetical protein
MRIHVEDEKTYPAPTPMVFQSVDGSGVRLVIFHHETDEETGERYYLEDCNVELKAQDFKNLVETLEGSAETLWGKDWRKEGEN